MPILYNTKRPHVYGPNGAVSTSNPYGAQAGLEMLKAGGNAADADADEIRSKNCCDCGKQGADNPQSPRGRL